MYTFLPELHNRILDQIDPRTGMLELDFSDEHHYQFFMEQVGGLEAFEKKHPHLAPVLQDLRTRPLLRTSKQLDSGYYQGPDNTMAIENLLFQKATSQSLEQVENGDQQGLALAAILAEYTEKKEHISVVSSLYNVTDGVLLHTTAEDAANSYSYQGQIQADYPSYFKDTPQEFMIQSTFYCSSGALSATHLQAPQLTAYVTKNSGFTLQGNTSIIKTFTLNDPVIQPAHLTDPNHTEVKISYKREGAIPDYDYTNDDQPFKDGNNQKILVRIPFSVTVEAADKWSIIGLDEPYGYRMWLKNMVNGTVNFYGNPDDIIQRKDAFDDQNRCIKMTFIFPQSWNNILDFSLVGYEAYTDVDFYSSFGVKMHGLTKDAPDSLTIPVSVKSDRKATDTDALNLKCSKIFIQWGCVARDTQIEMADGTTKRADEIQIGEAIRSASGEAVPVRKVLTGYEARLYQVSTANRSVRVTPDHILCTDQGLLLAIEVTRDMQVETVNGLERVTEAGWSDYQDTVYNFEFDTETVMIGNGFRMGDSMMQNRKRELTIHEN